MKVVGLITEYNPFHNGHEYHINEAKRITGADYVVVVMSGNFVQRGAPAITHKYTRTKMALSSGADLVIEIPACFATASAEYFAYGSIKLLDSLGFVDSICFGSECGNIELLTSIASLLLNEPDEYKTSLAFHLKQGMTFPLARKEAVLSYLLHHCEETYNLQEYEEILASPNNILGIEYIKALQSMQSSIKPFTIKRIMNNYHDEEINHQISSASSIRKTFLGNVSDSSVQEAIPASAYSYFIEQYHRSLPMIENDFSSLLFYKLLMSTEEELCTYLDVTEDLAKRIQNLKADFLTTTQFVDLLKSKNTTQTRIQRVLLHILLNIKKEQFYPEVANTPCYIRILGIKKTATHLLRKSSLNNTLPIITKVADAKQLLSAEQYQVFQQDLNTSHIYNQIVYQKYNYQITDEFRQGVIFF